MAVHFRYPYPNSAPTTPPARAGRLDTIDCATARHAAPPKPLGPPKHPVHTNNETCLFLRVLSHAYEPSALPCADYSTVAWCSGASTQGCSLWPDDPPTCPIRSGRFCSDSAVCSPPLVMHMLCRDAGGVNSCPTVVPHQPRGFAFTLTVTYHLTS